MGTPYRSARYSTVLVGGRVEFGGDDGQLLVGVEYVRQRAGEALGERVGEVAVVLFGVDVADVLQ